MIIQSTKDDIILLPATPKVWNDGHLHGSKVRGGAIVNLDKKMANQLDLKSFRKRVVILILFLKKNKFHLN